MKAEQISVTGNNQMQYEQIIDSCFEDKIGDNGIKISDYQDMLAKAQTVLQEIKDKKEKGNFPLLNHLESDHDLESIIQIGEQISDDFDELVVLGTGGSTLNPQSLVALSQPHAGIDKKVYFIDSVDPFTIKSFIEQLDLPNTAFLVTSKSGRTVETLSQFMSFLAAMDDAMIGDKDRHIFIITDPGENPLRAIGEQLKATIIDHAADIGGRFSTFTNVGLIPAVVAGVDARKLRTGAREAMNLFLNSPESAPVVGAALQTSFMQKGTNITVMMPYIDRLSAFATWFRQIWAESLGKDNKGSTPIKAVGALDQHSQLQLYLDGPKDKLFNLITLNTYGKGKKIDDEFIGKQTSYLKNHTVGDINASLQQATAETLVNNKCPVRHIKLDKMDEKVLSALMVHFMLETIIAADLLGVNAFDQPAVEEGKVLARNILGESS